MPKAEKGDHCVGGNRAPGRTAEQPNELYREGDRQQREKHRDRNVREFPDQRALKNHLVIEALRTLQGNYKSCDHSPGPQR